MCIGVLVILLAGLMAGCANAPYGVRGDRHGPDDPDFDRSLNDLGKNYQSENGNYRPDWAAGINRPTGYPKAASQ